MSQVRDPFAPRAPRALGPRPVGGRPGVGPAGMTTNRPSPNMGPSMGPTPRPMSPGGWSTPGLQLAERSQQVGAPHPYPSNPDNPLLPMGTAPGDPPIDHTPGFGLHDPGDNGVLPPGTPGAGPAPGSGSGSGAGAGVTPTPGVGGPGAGGMGPVGDPNNATNVENILRRWGL